MPYTDNNNRRSFLKKGLALSSASVFTTMLSANAASISADDDAGKNFVFLFQGDSITDGNRTRNKDWNHVMGHGYQYIIASKLWYDFPAKQFHFYNRGISGNKITDLQQRWDADTIDIKPDLLSILIGINDLDAWMNDNTKFTAADFETSYRNLLKQTISALPLVQLVLCEPFILPVGKVKDKWPLYNDEIKKRQAVVKKLSAEFNAIHVPFQQAFNNALKRAPADYWIWDGIHPMPAGHELLALEWMKQVSKKLKFISKG
jgi:lysophospholipase L1-like esterase